MHSKKSSNRVTKEEREKIIELLKNTDMDMRAISTRMNIGEATISKINRESGSRLLKRNGSAVSARRFWDY